MVQKTVINFIKSAKKSFFIIEKMKKYHKCPALRTSFRDLTERLSPAEWNHHAKPVSDVHRPRGQPQHRAGPAEDHPQQPRRHGQEECALCQTELSPNLMFANQALPDWGMMSWIRQKVSLSPWATAFHSMPNCQSETRVDCLKTLIKIFFQNIDSIFFHTETATFYSPFGTGCRKVFIWAF